MKTRKRQGRRQVVRLINAAEAEKTLARLSATIDPAVLKTAKSLASVSGFKNSFSAYLNAVLLRDNKQRIDLLNERQSLSQMR